VHVGSNEDEYCYKSSAPRPILSSDVSNFFLRMKRVKKFTFQIPPHPRECRAKQESFNFIVIFKKNAL
jgi:hypothetical protein